MAVTPQTDVYLLKCPLELDNNHQLNFANKTAQANYFLSLPRLEAIDISYQRENNVIRFPAHIDTLLEYNYVMYKNENYSNKWFYAFITDMQYDNDYCTLISISTDYWQTWGFDIQFRQSMVEREHVADDTVGLHTIDEGLGTGELIINNVINKTICAPDTNFGYVVMAVTELPKKVNGDSIKPSNLNSRMYNGILQGCFLMIFEYNSTGINSLSNVIDWYVGQGKVDAITSIYALPKEIYPASATTSISYSDPFVADIIWLASRTGASDMGTTSITRNTSLNGYVPRNKKLLCYPFNYLMVTNNAGTNNIYHYEDFTNGSNVVFKYNGVVTEGASVKSYPLNYKKNTQEFAGYAYGTDMSQTPTFSWSSDFYLNWQAQNSVKGWVNSSGKLWQPFIEEATGGAVDTRSNLDIIQSSVEVVGSFAKTLGSILGIGQASKTPDQTNGNSTGDLNFSIGRCGFTYYQMSIRSEIASVLDSYFDMYGYKVSVKKVPNFTSRRNWNFIKTADLNIVGNVPNEAIDAIKGLFNKGITMWHNPATFLDYSQNNNIV